MTEKYSLRILDIVENRDEMCYKVLQKYRYDVSKGKRNIRVLSKIKAVELICKNELKKCLFKDVLNQRYEDVCGEIECVLVGKCPYCKTWIVDEGENSCPKCGKAVRWRE